MYGVTLFYKNMLILLCMLNLYKLIPLWIFIYVYTDRKKHNILIFLQQWFLLSNRILGKCRFELQHFCSLQIFFYSDMAIL